ncbi:MAG: nitroreductase [Bacteroidales bacterium]|nr:nitroreductase [Bacteroidales bacterium]
MNETIKNMLDRRSVKAYKSDVYPTDEQIAEICNAGIWAPSGMGYQNPIIIAVTNKELRDKLSKMNAAVMGQTDMDPFYGAPVVLIVLCKKWPNAVYDGSLVMANLMLAAHSMGIDSCWIHRAKEEFESEEGLAILKELGIEGEYEGIGHCILGYAASEKPAPKPRKEGRVFWIR